MNEEKVTAKISRKGEGYQNLEKDNLHFGELDMAFSGLNICDMQDCCRMDNMNENDYRIKPFSRRSFLFYPTYKDTYMELKKVNLELAISFIESLMNFGVDNEDIPDNPILKATMAGPKATIEKAYTNYVIARGKNNREQQSAYE